MAKRGKLRVGRVLLCINVLVLAVIIGIYTGRLIKYYKLEHADTGENETSLLVDALRKKRSYVDLTKGLVCDDDTSMCRYKGEVNDNYLTYSGNTYRILGIDSKNNIYAVSEKNVTLMYSGLEHGYNNSYINKWLNMSDKDHSGIFENILFNTEILDFTNMCSDKISDVENIECHEINDENRITLLSLYDYKEAGGKSSFLNNGESYYLSTLDENNEVYYITPSGDISVIKNIATVSGVRPVITINYNTELISGKGTKNSPYVIEKHDVKTLADVYVGDYVSFKDVKYRVVNRTEETTKVAGTDVLDDLEGKLLKSFGGTNNKYSKNSKTIGRYLNDEYYKTIEDDNIVESPWYIGNLELGNLDYANKYTSNVKLKVGMLGLGDMYVNDLKNVLTISRGIESYDVISVITKEGNVYSDSINTEYNVRSSFYLKSTMEVKSGDGSLDKPYVLGVANENK
jgi:hypothetical protein